MVSRLSIVAGDIAGDGKADDKLWGDYYYSDDVDSISPFGHPLIENTSYQYSSMAEACYSDEKPLWWLVLRWMKMMLLKTARSYHAKPLLLAAGPLFIGILIGFFIGKCYSQSSLEQPKKSKKQASQKRNQQREKGQGMYLQRIEKLAEFLSAVWYFLRLVPTFILPPQTESATHANASARRELSVAKIHTGAVVGSKTGSRQNRKIHHDERSTVGQNDETELSTRESNVRSFLKSKEGTRRESGVPVDLVPRHVAVIMDGNRRYGKAKYGSATRGHWDGSSKLVEFAKWCIAENISVLTVYAFSSENWKRDPSEIASLMQIFTKYCDELRIEAIERNIKIMVLSTDYEKVPRHVKDGVKRMVDETQHCDGMIMNICLSYGSRNEMVGATKLVVDDVLEGKLDPKDIDEQAFGERLLTSNCGGDPDVLIRTSGEVRLSNFLLWQLAYTEFFFVDKPWPAIERNDLMEVIRTYAKGRNRRFGK